MSVCLWLVSALAQEGQQGELCIIFMHSDVKSIHNYLFLAGHHPSISHLFSNHIWLWISPHHSLALPCPFLSHTQTLSPGYSGNSLALLLNWCLSWEATSSTFCLEGPTHSNSGEIIGDLLLKLYLPRAGVETFYTAISGRVIRGRAIRDKHHKTVSLAHTQN